MSTPVNGIGRFVPGLVERLNPAKELGTDQTAKTEGGFGEMLSEFVGGVNKLHHESADIQQSFLEGEPVELHQVMVKAEEAGVATELLIEIRNKLIEGYNELIRMPV